MKLFIIVNFIYLLLTKEQIMRSNDSKQHHASSNKNYDDGNCDARRKLIRSYDKLKLKVDKLKAIANAALKRTRSGQKYDDGLNDATRRENKRNDKRYAIIYAALKRTRSGKEYEGNIVTATHMINLRLKRKKKQREKLAAAEATAKATAFMAALTAAI